MEMHKYYIIADIGDMVQVGNVLGRIVRQRQVYFKQAGEDRWILSTEFPLGSEALELVKKAGAEDIYVME
jgi:hypothetical protein